MYKGFSILSADLSSEILDIRQWADIFKMVKEENRQQRSLYLPKLYFKSEGEIFKFPDKQKLKKFVTIRPALQEKLNEVQETEMKGH